MNDDLWGKVRDRLPADCVARLEEHLNTGTSQSLASNSAQVAMSLNQALDSNELRRGPGADSTKSDAGPYLDLAAGVLYLNGRPISLELNEHDVLKPLVEQGAMSLDCLKRLSECATPNKVLSRLREKYPDLREHIVLPGRKGRGGYSTTIRRMK